MHTHIQTKPFTLSDGTKGVTSLSVSQYSTEAKTILFKPSIIFQGAKDKKVQPKDIVLVLDVSSSMTMYLKEYKEQDHWKKTFSEYKIIIVPPPSVIKEKGKKDKVIDPFNQIKPNRCEIYLRKESKGYRFCVVGKSKGDCGNYTEVVNKGILTLNYDWLPRDGHKYYGDKYYGLIEGPISWCQDNEKLSILKTDLIINSQKTEISPNVFIFIFEALMRRKFLHKLAPIDILIKSLAKSIESLPSNSCRYSIITFAANAQQLAVHADSATAIKILQGIHCKSGTNINAGLGMVTKKLIPNHLNGIIVLCTDGYNSTVKLTHQDQKETAALLEVDTAISVMDKEFQAGRPQLWALGLGVGYFDSVVRKYAEKTEGAFYHLDKAQDIEDFFKEQSDVMAGTQRIPVKFKLTIGGGYETFARQSTTGISIGRAWTEVFECDIEDLDLLTFELTYSVNDDKETVTQTGTFQTIAKVLPVIDLYVQQKAASIFGSQMTDSQKVIALQKLLPLCQPFEGYKSFASAKNIQSMLQSLQAFSGKTEVSPEEKSNMLKMKAQLTQMQLGGGTAAFNLPLIKTIELQYNAHESTIFINQKPHRIIDRFFDFADSKVTSKPFVSVDESEESLAGTLISKSFYAKLEKNFSSLWTSKSKNQKEYLINVIARVLFQFPGEDISVVEKHSVSKNFPYTYLKDFLRTSSATFREVALTTAAVVGKAVEKGLLPAGKVHRYRAVSYQLKPHAWTVYDVPGKSGGLFIIDPMLATKNDKGLLKTVKIYNLRDPKDALLAIAAYKKAGLEGILENMFKQYKLPGHPRMSCLTEEAVVLAEKRAKAKGVSIEMSDLCPVSKRMMREPVILQTKDGRRALFDNKFVQDDLKKGIHPLTKAPLPKETIVRTAPGKLRKMWDEISKAAAGLTEIESKPRPKVTELELMTVQLDEEALTEEMTELLPQFAPGSVMELKEIQKEVIIDVDELEKEAVLPAPSAPVVATPVSSINMFSAGKTIAFGHQRAEEKGCAYDIAKYLKENMPNSKLIKEGRSTKAVDSQQQELRCKMRASMINAVDLALRNPGDDLACLNEMLQRLSTLNKSHEDFNKLRHALIERVIIKIEELTRQQEPLTLQKAL